MSLDPVAANFTPERLKRYRELHYRYPLWCGDWVYRSYFVPEEALVSRPHRFDLAIREAQQAAGRQWRGSTLSMPGGYTAKAAEPTLSKAPIPELASGEEASAPRLPSIFQALFAAINYVLAPWKPEAFGPAYHEPERVAGPPENPFEGRAWTDAIAHALVEGNDWYYGIMNRRYKVSGIILFQLRMRALDPKLGTREREKARKDLLAYWKKVGEEAGILPTARSDKAHSIPPNELRNLADSAKAMLAELKRYKTTNGEEDAVRVLLTDPPYVAASTKWEVVQHNARERDRLEGDARKVYEAKYRVAQRAWDQAAEVKFWCVQLAFPMLSRDEILTARPRLEDAVKPSKKGHYWLFQSRFGLDPDRIREELARNRTS